ncbi:hypothetical protein [Streptacidiphilus sp. PAMC 29251]
MRVGFFREMPHGDAAGPSLAEACGGIPQSNEDEIAAYLDHGHIRVPASSLAHDVFDPDELIHAPHHLTDGRFEWPGDLAHYVRNYHLRLPEPFVEHMRANAWRVPSDVDVAAPLPLARTRWADVRWMTSEREVAERLSRLVPHDAECHVYEIAHAGLARSVLPQLPADQYLIAAAAAGPVLWDQIQASFGYSSLLETMEHFRDQFPPKEPIPATVPSFPPEFGTAIEQLAEGEPGDPVAQGLFPSRVTVLARLLLSRADIYPADAVLRAAEQSFGRDHGSRPTHDAFACALVHPRIDAVGLAEWHQRQPRDHLDHHARRRTDQLLAWARFHGYLPDPSGCPCGHHRFTVPRTRRDTTALYKHRQKIDHLLAPIELDPSRWLGVYACTLCGKIWAEDDITSGHAELFFYYPITTTDPKAWLSRAEPLQPRIRSW